MIKNVLNLAFFLAFVLSAILQYNDPDPWAWIIIYSAAGCMCIAQYLEKPPAWLPAMLLGISLLWIASLIPNIAGQVSWTEIFDSISMRTRAVEEAREIGGLAFIAIWAAALLFISRRATSPSER